MGTFKDIYDILKDLRKLAKESSNQPMMDLAVSIQDQLFDMNEEMQNLKDENKENLIKLEKLELENKVLQEKVQDYDVIKKQLEKLTKNDSDLAFDNTLFTIHFTEIVYILTSNTVIDKKQLNLPLDKIFKAISLQMTSPITNKQYISSFTALCQGYQIDQQDALTLKAQFLALGLIELTTNKKDEELIKLTPKGLMEMKKLNTIKQGESNGK